MKRFIFILATLISSLALSAQEVSYLNMILYGHLDDMELITSSLEEDDYELSACYFDDDEDMVTVWTWGACIFDEDEGLVYSNEVPWAAFRIILDDDSETVAWQFSSTVDYKQIKIDLLDNGWKLETTEADAQGFHSYYTNTADNEIFALTEGEDFYTATYYIPVEE